MLEALGLAFHAARDFYTHTYWTDVVAPSPATLTNPPGLRHRAAAGWIDPAKRPRMPRGLITGCFEGIPESRYCKGRVRHADLNKDTGSIDVKRSRASAGTTPRGKINGNFARAVRGAVADTLAKWAWFETTAIQRYGVKRGLLIVCTIRRDRPDGC